MEQGNHKVRIRIRNSQENFTDIENTSAVADDLEAVQNDHIEKSEMETVIFGKYYKKNGRHYLFYDELIEGTDGVTSNRVIIAPDRMELVRKGALNTVMTFESGRMIREDYHTPYGTLSMGVDTKKFLVCENEDGLFIQTEYLLEVNGAYASFNRMEIYVDLR